METATGIVNAVGLSVAFFWAPLYYVGRWVGWW